MLNLHHAEVSEVVIYTDGACRGNPGPGGSGALLEYGKHNKELSGAERKTTNNRMELTAAISALESLSRSCQVRLYTDSVYVKNGITLWLVNWKQKNWKTTSRKPVKNMELWQQLDLVCQKHNIDWQWVKGHAGNPGNEKADQLANQAIDQMMNLKES